MKSLNERRQCAECLDARFLRYFLLTRSCYFYSLDLKAFFRVYMKNPFAVDSTQMIADDKSMNCS
jgi:hypothetical protein